VRSPSMRLRLGRSRVGFWPHFFSADTSVSSRRPRRTARQVGSDGSFTGRRQFPNKPAAGVMRPLSNDALFARPLRENFARADFRGDTFEAPCARVSDWKRQRGERAVEELKGHLPIGCATPA